MIELPPAKPVAYWVSASKALIKTVSRLKAAGFFSFPI